MLVHQSVNMVDLSMAMWVITSWDWSAWCHQKLKILSWPTPTSTQQMAAIPGLVNIQKTDGKITMLSGKIHYFDWAMFNRFLYVYQAGYFQGEHDDYPLDLDLGFSLVFYAKIISHKNPGSRHGQITIVLNCIGFVRWINLELSRLASHDLFFCKLFEGSLHKSPAMSNGWWWYSYSPVSTSHTLQ